MLAEQWSWKHPGGLQQQLEQQPNKHKQQQGAQAESLIPATKVWGAFNNKDGFGTWHRIPTGGAS